MNHIHPKKEIPRESEIDAVGITTYQDTETLIAENHGTFDVVYCMEVCEHLSHEKIFEAFHNIRELAKYDAVIVFGVPLETGLSGFSKNIFRWLHGRRQNATLGRAIKSLFGLWIPRASAPRGWIGSHIGFDATAFSELFRYGGFDIVKRHYLPFPYLRGVLNNEVYFVCKLTDPA